MKNKISTATIIRTIVMIITLVNSILTMCGKNPLPWAAEEIYADLSAAASFAATLWAWWKNNSFTSAAIEADNYMKNIKNKETNENE